MAGQLSHQTVLGAVADCRRECARHGLGTGLLDLLPDARHVEESGEDPFALASEWGRAMALAAPSEDELLWIGGVWLATANRIFGADSEMAEELGLWFAAAAERALSQPDPGTV